MQEHTTMINGKKTQFFRTGNGPKKLIFLHGWDQNIDLKDSFKALVNNFQKKKLLNKYEIIIPYFPGFGGSQPPESTGWTTFDYADWLDKFLQKVSPETKKFTFLTHSFGGRVLVRFLAKHQDKAEKAIILASAGIKWPLSIKQKITIFLSQKLQWIKKGLPKKLQKIIKQRLLGARDWDMVSEALKPTLTKVLAENDFRKDLSTITIPILLFWGAKDTYTPLRSGDVFAKKLPKASLIVFPNGTHGIHRTHAKEITEKALPFLCSTKK